MNKALLSKWLWRFGQENGSLWKQVIVSKYEQTNVLVTNTPHGVSWWKGIMQMVEKFKEAIQVEVGSGMNTSFLA